MRLVLVGAAALVVSVTLVGCGTSSPTGVEGPAIKPISASRLPNQILGLDVHLEDVKNTVARAKNTYVDAVSIFSLRRSNLVQATLQVSSLTDKFKVKRPRQRAALADKIGGARSQPFRLGSDTVYLTQGIRQRIAVWFRGHYLFVLSSREDFDQPRSLLREALEVRP
jgi:hypothetical protein